MYDCATQVVQSGGKNIELAVIRRNQPLKVIHLLARKGIVHHVNPCCRYDVRIF